MMRSRKVAVLLGVAVGVAVLAAFAVAYIRGRGDTALKPFVHGKPTYPVVFTSRTDPASFRAAAAVGDYSSSGAGLRAPGVPQWQAREGRLRVLLTSGGARELTWGKPLPDGGTLIDVMSPSVSADGTGLVRHDPPVAGLTRPTDRWFGAAIAPTGEQFCQVVKVAESVWRVRPLFGGAYVFMTVAPGSADPFTASNEHPERGILAVAQANQGRVSSAPSSLAAGMDFPRQNDPALRWAPHTTPDGRTWSLATPAPMPPDRVLVSAAPTIGAAVPPGGYGIYELSEDGWGADPRASGVLKPLFDDPDFVDAEPVAAYPRPIDGGPVRANATWSDSPVAIPLAGGVNYSGPAGRVHNLNLFSPETGKFPGQKTDAGGERLVPPFPQGSITTIAFYAARRDRFDDPTRGVVVGALEKLLVVPAIQEGGGGFDGRLPTGDPTLLVGVGPDGRVASVDGAADATGRGGKFYAFAGDHVSGVRPGGYHFCTGCHAGHTFNPAEQREKVK